jgi:hypothetical protein
MESTPLSNAAFNAGTGYPNRSGQNGCIDSGENRP